MMSVSSTLLGAVLLMQAIAAPPAESTDRPKAAAASAPALLPDLGTIRYHDPARRREAWVGIDGGGVAIPAATTGLGRSVWSAHVAPTWALALLPRLALGGRHRISWYNAGNARLRVHSHELELSGRAIRSRPRLRDRPALGVEVHDVERSVVDGVDFRLGGIHDLVLHAGYGLEHELAPWLQLGWRVHLRHAWVLRETQWQGRASTRLALLPAVRHRLSLELVGHVIDRGREPRGAPLPRRSIAGQIIGEYTWISTRGVGLTAGARYCTSFLSGEAPIYEIRSESLHTHYGEVFAGLRVVWE